MPFSLPDLKILIAEDHFAMCQMISAVLRSKNVAFIDIAPDGKIALDMLESARNDNKPYHMVFLDWEMPQVSGIEVLRFCRARTAYVNTAFIMVTAMSIQSQVLEAVKAGATAYMVKPVSQETIGRKFDDILIWVTQMNV